MRSMSPRLQPALSSALRGAGVAGGQAPELPTEDRRQASQGLQIRVSPNAVILSQRLPEVGRNVSTHDLLFQPTVVRGGGRQSVASQGEAVLRFAGGPGLLCPLLRG